MWANITGNIQHPYQCSLKASKQQFTINYPNVNRVTVKYTSSKNEARH